MTKASLSLFRINDSQKFAKPELLQKGFGTNPCEKVHFRAAPIKLKRQENWVTEDDQGWIE